MSDFLLELRSEEIPARMQDDARANLARLFAGELAKAGLEADEIVTYATPRRLALIAKGLPIETQAVSEETKGPKTSAPPQALEGFLRKTGLTQDQLIERDGIYFAVVEKAGRKTADVLAEAIPVIVRAFPWPKSQRWGAASVSTESLRWVRPLQGIVALLGDEVVGCEVDGIVSGSATMGHRFHHSGLVTIGNVGDYAMKLRAAHVIVDQGERRAIIRDGADKAASDAGLVLVEDEGLVRENAGLTEWPVPMLGRFDPAFLAVPEEVIQLTARVNQKYFICRDAQGGLANAFVCTANVIAHDGGAAIVAGNEKVLAARLSDAKFFWEQDLKIPLETQAEKLSAIVFHEKLGTVADKVERVAKLARWLVEERIISPRNGEGDRREAVVEGLVRQNPSVTSPKGDAPPPHNGEVFGRKALADQAETAARLCKADLVTGMVGEFPELQGIMGGYYARAQGHSDAIADAIRDHYKPVGQGDDVPTAPVTVAVSLADKLDTLVGFFLINERPTGSKDPFALRRAVLSTNSLLATNALRLPLIHIFWAWLFFSLGVVKQNKPNYGWTVWLEELFHKPNILNVLDENHILQTTSPTELPQRIRFASEEVFLKVEEGFTALLSFFADRLKVQQREAGVRHDLIDAVFALGGEDDLVRLLARVKALQAFVDTEDGVNLLAAYKRAANILKSSPSELGEDQKTPPPTPPASGKGEEAALLTALNAAEPLAIAAIEAEDFEGAMVALASLREPVDAFFENVMVNDNDPAIRAFRIGLLNRVRDAVHRVADFSKIEG